MSKLALMAAVASLVFCHAMNANATNPTWTSGAVQSEHYVGFTTATTTGAAGGEVAMNYMCQHQYGETAHICTAGGYFATSGSSTPVTDKWLEPSVGNCVGVGTSLSTTGVLCQIPTLNNGAFTDPAGFVQSCENWTSQSASDFGTAAEAATHTNGHLEMISCNTALHVACCGP